MKFSSRKIHHPSVFHYVSILLLASIFCMNKVSAQTASVAPVRLVVVGIKHVHVPWILERKKGDDIQLVGVYEPDKELARRYAKRFGLDSGLFYTDLPKMLDAVKPEAAVAFGSVYEHMDAVEACAPRGIHVMVEKPLATNLAHAKKMEALAKKNNIYLLTNYETSWYPTTAKTYQLVNDSNYIGALKKVVVHDGHEGPKEIGLNKESLDWLIDPVQAGGGALIDFGCYGANLMTWLMKGQQPLSVTAVTRQFKPSVYPKVDDEATIIVEYPTAQCIIQASWNWPFSRKDMEVYGQTGYVIADNHTDMRIRNKSSKGEQLIKVNVNDMAVYEDPFSYFSDVIRGKIKLPENGLYSLATNVTVVRILEAARESARLGKTIRLQKEPRR
jgi:predicted dehydrogenase